MSALAVTPDQEFWDEKQIAVLETLGLRDATKADMALFLAQCQRTGLDPFNRQIYMIKRGGRFTFQTSIDGFRLIADRAADRRGWLRSEQDTLWYDQDGHAHTEWLSETPPAAAKYTVEILSNGQCALFHGFARFDEYAVDGPMWKKMPALMIAKCAEALALRKAFPNDLSGIYSDDEMSQADKRVKVEQPKAELPAPPEPVDVDDETMELLGNAIAACVVSDDEGHLKEMWEAHESLLDVAVPNHGTMRDAITTRVNELRLERAS